MASLAPALLRSSLLASTSSTSFASHSLKRWASTRGRKPKVDPAAPLAEESPQSSSPVIEEPISPTPVEPAPAASPLSTADASSTPLAPGTEGAVPLTDSPNAPPAVDLSTQPVATSSSSTTSSSAALSALTADWSDERYRAKSTASGKFSQSSIEKKRQNTTRAFLTAGVLGTLWMLYNLGRPWESEREREKMGGSEASRGGSVNAHIERAKARGFDMLDYFNKPAWDPLLPPPLPEPHQRPYTLVIDLDDLLVHSEWDRANGWRTAKRPGVDYFLGYLSQFYEIVIFTTQPSYTALPITEKLDPMGLHILYKLFRESTRYVDGGLVKDLNYLGRDLSKVLVLDTNPDHFKLHPENGVKVPSWTGERGDLGLIRLIPFLEAVGILNVPDIRAVIRKYNGLGKQDNIPLAFAEEQAKLKQIEVAKWEADEDKRKKSIVGGGFGRFLGFASPAAAASPAGGPPLTMLERARKAAQEHYAEETKYFKDNAAIIQKQMDEDRDRQLKEMKTSVLGFLTGNISPAKTEQGTSADLV